VTAAVQQALSLSLNYVAFRVQTAVETDFDSLNDVWFFGAAANPDVLKRPTLLFGPVPVSVEIDIIPGSAQNAVNLSGAGVIPVAILSSPTFDALQVDPATITLAGANVRMIGASNRFLC